MLGVYDCVGSVCIFWECLSILRVFVCVESFNPCLGCLSLL